MSSSRPLGVLASVVLAVLGFVLLIPDYASACSFAGGSREGIAKTALGSSSDAVFSGEVVGLDTLPTTSRRRIAGMWSPGPTIATLRVYEVWRGPKQQTIEIFTPRGGAMCGYPFKEGREYLVYASEGPSGGSGDLRTTIGSETKLLSKAGANLAVLGDGGRSKGGGEVLTDTSGGVSVGAMVGMAGLVMAASLLVVVRLVRTG